MIQDPRLVREAAARVGAAVERVTEALADTRVEHEPAFTDRMLQAIETEMDAYASRGVSWRAKTLTDRGRNSQESRYGADFAGVLSIAVAGFSVNKGFLAQAKLLERGDTFSSAEYASLFDQCDRMLSLTPDSFVFLYARTGVTVIPAISVASSSNRSPYDFYARTIARFYEEHFESFIGDRRLAHASASGLEDLALKWRARAVLYLEAQGS